MSIELIGVHKSYPTRQGPNPILRNVNLHVRPGEHVGILGQNGAGKSTLIRVLGGSERPTSGTVVRTMSVSWPLAFGGAFLGALTGIDNVRFVCRLYGVDPKEKLPFVQEFTELGKYLREPVRSYSSGMRARLAFAVSMAVDFDCYLIDEIVAVGDDRFQRKCQLELFEKRAHKAMLFVSHSPDFIRQHCDRASVLTAGELINFDNVDDAYIFYTSHELAIQPHMAETAAAVYLPDNAVQLIADEYARTGPGEAFEEFLAANNVDRAPVFDSCDLIGRLGNSGQFDAGLAVARFVTTQRPNEPLFWITMGDLYCGRRQHIPGVESYREALREDPGSYWGNRNLATEFFNVGRYEEAIPIYEAAMAVAPTSSSRLELQLRWLDCRTLLDRETGASQIDLGLPPGTISVIDQSAAALNDGRTARLSLGGIASASVDAAQLSCFFRGSGTQWWPAQLSLARNSIRRLARSAGVSAFGFIFYGPIAETDTEIHFEIRNGEDVLAKGVQPLRHVPDTDAAQDGPPLAAARQANAEHRAEASVLLYGLSEAQGVEADIVPFAENLIATGLYDEAEDRLTRWLDSHSPDHPDREFVIDLACAEIARARVRGWREEIDRLLAREERYDRSVSVLANLGHARVADGELGTAVDLYAEASSKAAGKELIHFARGIHTAKFASNVGRDHESAAPSTRSDDRDVVHLFACDARYFLRFAPSLVASSRQKSGAVKLAIHAHIIDPDAESLALARQLSEQHGINFSTEETPPAIGSQAVQRAYFTCARFLIAPDLVRSYRCPVLITEADCLINWEWAEIMRYSAGADVGYARSGLWNWVPWTKIPAGIFLVGNSSEGLGQADYVARFVRHAFAQEGGGATDLWTVDQVALWLAQLTSGPIRSLHLPMSSILTLATGDKANVLDA